MVRKLQVPIVSAGAAALVAIEDLQQVPMQAWLIRPESFDQFGDVQDSFPPTGEAVDRQSSTGLELLTESVFCERKLRRHGDPRCEMGRRTVEGFIPAPVCLQALSGNELR
jgi:hypothetical protein